jgi:hypothetical protein
MTGFAQPTLGGVTTGVRRLLLAWLELTGATQGRPQSSSAIVCLGACVRESCSFSLQIAAVVGSPPLLVIGVLRSPLPITAAGVCSPPLTVLGVLGSLLPVAAVRGSRLVSIPSPAAVVFGQVLSVRLLPSPLACLALRISTVLARAVAPEFRSRLVFAALGAALQVIRGRRGLPRWNAA